MIRLQPKPTFQFKVELSVPGSEEPARFTLVGKHMGQAALSTWAEKAKELQGQDAAFLAEVITDWSGVTGEDGKAVKFDKDALATLIDAYPGSGLQVFTAYIKELSAGRGKN
jgi:hypothetical protein